MPSCEMYGCVSNPLIRELSYISIKKITFLDIFCFAIFLFFLIFHPKFMNGPKLKDDQNHLNYKN